MNLTKLAAIAAVTIGTAAVAHANTLTQVGTVSNQTTDFDVAFSVPSTGNFAAFNSTYGTLTSVVATLTAQAQDSGTVTNTSSGQQTFTFTTANNTVVDGKGAPAPLSTFFGGAGSLSFSSTSNKYTLAANQSANFPITGTNGFTNSPLTSTQTFTSASDLAAFSGANFNASMGTQTGQSFVGGGGNITTALTTTEGGTLTIVYNFTPPAPPPVVGVPEPMSLALLGAGLAGVGMIRRRRA